MTQPLMIVDGTFVLVSGASQNEGGVMLLGDRLGPDGKEIEIILGSGVLQMIDFVRGDE